MRVCDVKGCTNRAIGFLELPEYHNAEDEVDLCYHHRERALQLLGLYLQGDLPTLAALEESFPAPDDDEEIPF